jgi:hypothetical protein
MKEVEMSTNQSTLLCRTTLAASLLLLAALGIAAQTDGRFAQLQQQNAAALKQYEWKSRTEIQKGGETKKVQLALMRYDRNGNLQATPISSTPEPDLPKFGLRKIVAQKKVQEFKDKLEALRALARSYSDLPPDRMQQFMTRASIRPELTAKENLIRIEGRDVLQPGDSMTVFLDAVSRKQRRVEIQTSLDQRPVRIVSEFQDLTQGPTHMARSQVSYDGASIVIVTENFDYTRTETK